MRTASSPWASKVFIGNGNNNKTKATPVLTLYKDADNYIRFTPI